jgi:adenylate cyclase
MPEGLEIERKFVLDRPPPALDEHPRSELEQGYIAIGEDGTEVRIRRSDDRHFLTIKSGGSGSRVEEEIEIDERRFRALWPLTESRRIEKTRSRVPAPDGVTVEVDVYRGRHAGLLTAEVEFDSIEAAEAFQPPEWMGREVTSDERYKNKRLATDGLPEVT